MGQTPVVLITNLCASLLVIKLLIGFRESVKIKKNVLQHMVATFVVSVQSEIILSASIRKALFGVLHIV